MNSKYKGRKLTPFPKISQDSKQLGREGAGPRPRGPLDIWTTFGGARGSGWAARGAKGALEAPTRGRLTWESMGSQAQGSHKVPPGRDWGGHRGAGMARVDRGPAQRGEGWTGLGPGAVDGRGRPDFTDSAQEPGPQAGGRKAGALAWRQRLGGCRGN